MKINNITIFLIIVLAPLALAMTDGVFKVKESGAKGDGITLDTKAIQSAIDKCAVTGGTVYFSPGTYLTGSLTLQSNVTLFIEKGAKILGSTNLKDYKEYKPALKSYNDLFLKYSLFYAEGLENISIIGEGTIDGQGSKFKVTTTKKPERYMDRPFVIRFIQCKNVKVEGVTLKNSPMWMQQYLACENVFIRGINVYNHSNKNNDMMDIDGCKNVIISDCVGDTDDDGITLKSTSEFITENVTITNCIISSHCNALKFGTESTGGFRNITISNIIIKPSAHDTVITGYANGISGITLATVDGGIIDGVIISGIRIIGPQVPVYLRLGNRARKHTEDAPKPNIGSFRNVILQNIIADNVGSIGCSITGIPGSNIDGISFENIKINFAGGVNKLLSTYNIEELEDSYPESTMFGTLPAYGFFIRHADNVSFSNIVLSNQNQDNRPAFYCNNVKNIDFDNITAETIAEADAVFYFEKASNVKIRSSQTNGYGSCFLKITDNQAKDFILSGNNLYNIKNPVISDPSVKVIQFNNHK